MQKTLNFRIMQTYNTMDYSRFKYIQGNRKIDHYRNVAKSIEKLDLTPYNPILVTKDFEILDGQNRFEACKMLNKPIHYCFCELDVPTGEIIRALNTTQRNWRNEDYVQSWVDLGNDKMIEFVKWAQFNCFNEKHFGVAAKVYFGLTRTTETLRDGNLPEKWCLADEIGNWLSAVRDKNIPYWDRANFVDAVVAFRKTHTEKEMAKLLRHIDKVPQYGNAASFMNRMQQIVDAVKVR